MKKNIISLLLLFIFCTVAGQLPKSKGFTVFSLAETNRLPKGSINDHLEPSFDIGYSLGFSRAFAIYGDFFMDIGGMLHLSSYNLFLHLEKSEFEIPWDLQDNWRYHHARFTVPVNILYQWPLNPTLNIMAKAGFHASSFLLGHKERTLGMGGEENQLTAFHIKFDYPYQPALGSQVLVGLHKTLGNGNALGLAMGYSFQYGKPKTGSYKIVPETSSGMNGELGLHDNYLSIGFNYFYKISR